MQRGYIKIWRKLEDSGLLQMHGTLALFMFILLKAAHKPIKIGTPTGIVELERGQYMSGRHKLAADVLLSEQAIRTCLARLERLDILRVESTSRYSIYTIVNYSNYQDTNQQSNQQSTNSQPAINQQLTTKQTLQELKALEALKEKQTPCAAFALPDWIDADDWRLWVSVRKKMNDEQKQRQVKKLEKWKNAGLDYRKALSDAADNSWQGLVEPTGRANGSNRPQTVQESRLDCINQIMGNRHGHANKIIDISAIGSDSSDGASVPKIDGEVWKPDGDKMARLKHG